MPIQSKHGFTFDQFVKITDSYIFDENKEKFEKLSEDEQALITQLSNYDYNDFKAMREDEAKALNIIISSNG